MSAAAVLAVLGGVGLATCQWEGDSPGPGCTVSMYAMASGVGGALLAGGFFVYRTNRESRAMSRAGLRVSRIRGILGTIFYALPYTQIVGLILAARQMRINRRALDQFEADGLNLQPRYF